MSELISHFGIDWKLLLAQAVNFLILLAILKKFAYGPVLRMLKKRREVIEKGLKFSKEAEEKLLRIAQEREGVLRVSRNEALEIVNSGEKVAKERREEIIREAQARGEMLLQEAKRVIEEEKAKMGEALYKETGEVVRLALAKVLGKMPQEERDDFLIGEALKELKTAYRKS